MRTRLLLTGLLAAGAAALAEPAAAEPAAADWPAIARRDMEFAGSAMASMHAGVAAGQPSVTVPLETGLRAGLAEAATVHSALDYRRLMRRFISGFGDPHTGIDLHQNMQGWTGLLIDRVDGRYRVVWSEPGWPAALPPAGAQVQSCDGVWFGTYLQTAVAPFAKYSVEYDPTFSLLAIQSMFDLGLGWTPKRCVFVLPDGSRKTYALAMRGTEDPAMARQAQAAWYRARSPGTPVGLSSIGAGKTWVGMPNFDGASSGAAYEALYPRLAALPKSGWVVFDLRGNGGGNSSWGTRALAALFGDGFAEHLSAAGGAEKYLVANANTVAVLKHYISAPEFGADKSGFEADLARVEAAMRAGEKLALVAGEPGAADAPVAGAKRPNGPRIAALIDRSCFSSCMNFLQQIRAIDDSVVLGEATIGYSPFGEISRVALPSGLGSLAIPTAWYKTAQATREPFVPDLAYTGDMADTAALQRWVAAQLAQLDKLDKPGAGQASALKASSGKPGSRR
jgi:hypothetical protein